LKREGDALARTQTKQRIHQQHYIIVNVIELCFPVIKFKKKKQKNHFTAASSMWLQPQPHYGGKFKSPHTHFVCIPYFFLQSRGRLVLKGVKNKAKFFR
jgi:hypothetical protein